MIITRKTRISEILKKYGDIAEVMEVMGVKRVARYSFRRLLTNALTVEMAARIHRIPVDEMIDKLNKAIVSLEISEN